MGKLKSQIEHAEEDGKGRRRRRRQVALKTRIENVGGRRMGRVGWMAEGGDLNRRLKTQGRIRFGEGGQMEEGDCNSQIQNVGEDRMGRGG